MPIDREMVGMFTDQHISQQGRPRGGGVQRCDGAAGLANSVRCRLGSAGAAQSGLGRSAREYSPARPRRPNQSDFPSQCGRSDPTARLMHQARDLPLVLGKSVSLLFWRRPFHLAISLGPRGDGAGLDDLLVASFDMQPIESAGHRRDTVQLGVADD